MTRIVILIGCAPALTAMACGGADVPEAGDEAVAEA